MTLPDWLRDLLAELYPPVRKPNKTHNPPTPGQQLARLQDRKELPVTKAREIRHHAENWYQALKKWDLIEGETIQAGPTPRRGGGMSVAGVGGYSLGVKCGPGGGISITSIMLRTPIGPVSASLAAQVVTGHGEALTRLRNDTSLQSLISSNGRGWKSPTARRYAVMVLDIAANLGDRRAAAMHRVLTGPDALQSVPDSPSLSLD